MQNLKLSICGNFKFPRSLSTEDFKLFSCLLLWLFVTHFILNLISPTQSDILAVLMQLFRTCSPWPDLQNMASDWQQAVGRHSLITLDYQMSRLQLFFWYIPFYPIWYLCRTHAIIMTMCVGDVWTNSILSFILEMMTSLIYVICIMKIYYQ